MLTIDLLRHGALVGGVKYRGIVDDPLTDEGLASMQQVWQRVKPFVTCIYSSPLSRCADPATLWANESDIPLQLDASLQELHYGDWEGKTPEQIRLTDNELLSQWRANPDGLQPPSGEAMDDFVLRVQNWFQATIKKHRDEHLLVVAHSGVLRALIAHALSAPVKTTRHLSMPYACWSRIQVDDRGESSLIFHAAGAANG